MLTKILIVVALVFVALGALRFAAAPPRPLWLAPALAGIATWAVLFRFGVLGVAAGAGVAALLWFAPRLWPRAGATTQAVTLSVTEAQALLGLGPTANEADIRAAHRRRIAEAHPDRGGDPAHAAKLNAARDTLLKAVKR
ncbi:MAG: hypothetical protein NW200_08100 [Hyphomonadaceae bacterium]|nr:hypothetical protein [Hyphomonadaceae bacterium]